MPHLIRNLFSVRVFTPSFSDILSAFRRDTLTRVVHSSSNPEYSITLRVILQRKYPLYHTPGYITAEVSSLLHSGLYYSGGITLAGL